MKTEGYVVMSLATHAEIYMDHPLAIKQEIPLNFAEGMIGVIPVFSSMEDAKAYCNGQSCEINKLIYKSNLNGES